MALSLSYNALTPRTPSAPADEVSANVLAEKFAARTRLSGGHFKALHLNDPPRAGTVADAHKRKSNLYLISRETRF
jgi:hypothetical protein